MCVCVCVHVCKFYKRIGLVGKEEVQLVAGCFAGLQIWWSALILDAKVCIQHLKWWFPFSSDLWAAHLGKKSRFWLEEQCPDLALSCKDIGNPLLFPGSDFIRIQAVQELVWISYSYMFPNSFEG